MTNKEKNSFKNKISTLVGKGLKEYGFVKTKSNWYVKEYKELALFAHLHCYSFCNSYRVHTGYRIFNDPFDAIALNGPEFEGQKIDNLINPETKQLYHLSFAIVKPTYVDCANQIITLFKNECLPWFCELEESNWDTIDAKSRVYLNSNKNKVNIERSLKELKLR